MYNSKTSACYPANTFGEPWAIDVQPAILSPILPAPRPLTITVLEPDAIGAVCGQQHGGQPHGLRCTVLISPCLDQGIPLTNTLEDPCARDGVEQCTTSASPILAAGGIM